MAKGDIVLITFPFTNLSGSKLRPAIVLTETNLDITVCFITSQINGKNKLILFYSQTT
jgi:mRNA interferase MazF